MREFFCKYFLYAGFIKLWAFAYSRQFFGKNFLPRMHEFWCKYLLPSRFIKLWVFVHSWLFFTPIIFAQDDSTRILNQVPINTLKDSVITIVVDNSTVPHFVLSIEKINNLAVTDVGGAMKFVPGVQLKDYGGIGGIKTVSFRSLGASHTSVTVDGNRIPNVQSGAINLSSFEIFGVRGISFSSGQINDYLAPASSYMQANSISVRSILSTFPRKFALKLYSNTTSINSYEEGILVQFPIKRRAFFGIQAMTKFGKGDYKFVYPLGGIDVEQRRQNSQLNNYKISAAGGIDLKNSALRFAFNYLNSEQELPGAIILYNSSNDQKLWNENFRFTGNYFGEKNNWSLNGNAFYQSNFTRYLDPNFLNLLGYIDNSYLQKNGGGGMMARRWFDTSPRSKLFFGSDIIYSQLTGSNLANSPTRLENNSVIGYDGGFRRFRIVTNISLQVIQDYSFSDTSTAVRDFVKPSLFISFAWMPLKDYSLKVRSFYKRSFLMPTFNDLYYNLIGNNLLKPEEANLFNLGISYKKTRKNIEAELSADFFYNQVNNKIVAIPTKDLFNWSMQNIGKVDIKGYDLGLLVSLKKKEWRFTLNSSYSYNQSLDVTDSESTTYEKQIPYTPFHSGTAGLAIDWKGFGFNANAIYSGFRYSLNENIYANYLVPFTDISVNLSKKIELKNKSVFELTLAANNLLNKNYEVIRSFPMPGRYYQFTFQFSL